MGEPTVLLSAHERADYDAVAHLLRGAALLAPAVRGRALRPRIDAAVGAHLQGLARFGGPMRLPIELTASAIEFTHDFEAAWAHAPPRDPSRALTEPLHYRDPATSPPADPQTQWRRALRRASAPLRARAGSLERALLGLARDTALASPAWGWLVSRVRPFRDDGLERVYSVSDLEPRSREKTRDTGPAEFGPCARVLSNPLIEPLVYYARERALERESAGAVASPWLPIIGLFALGLYPVALPDRLLLWAPAPADPRDGSFRLHASLGLWRIFDFGAPLTELAATSAPARYDARGFAPPRFTAYVPPVTVVVEGPLPPPELPGE